MKKATALIILALALCLSLCACGHMDKATVLAQYGEEMFLANDISNYMDDLREYGLEDLSAEPTFTYSFEDDYNKDNCRLILRCSIKFTSDSIDSYYTTTFNKSEGIKLAALMKTLLQHISSSYEYTYEDEKFSGTVIVAIEKPSHDLYIYTSEGRKYNYNYGYTDYVEVKIDGDYVYMKEEPSESSQFGNFGQPDVSNTTTSNEDSYGHDKYDAMVIAEKVVRSALKAPSTADFCSSSEYTVSCMGNTWTVKGYVDAQNSFGATLRSDFTVKFTFSDSSHYTVDSCNIT